MNDTDFEHDLRATLVARATYDVPASLYATARRLPEEAGRGMPSRIRRLLTWRGGTLRTVVSAATAVVGVVLIAVIGGLLVVSYAGRPMLPGAGGERAFAWQTSVASLEANSVAIEANGSVFRPPVDASIHSDPGDSTYRTLEMEWTEQGLEQRLYIYFAADDTDWWVSEIRTRDGRNPAEWVYYQAPQIRAPRGESYVGDLDLDGRGDNGDARLRITDLRLTAFTPGTGIQYQPGCQPAGPTQPPGDGPVLSMVNPDLSQLGIEAGMTAVSADAKLSSAGLCHDFRYDYPASNYGQIWCSPPPGKVANWAFGSTGQLILFVEAGPTVTLAPDAPLMVGCNE